MGIRLHISHFTGHCMQSCMADGMQVSYHNLNSLPSLVMKDSTSANREENLFLDSILYRYSVAGSSELSCVKYI